MRATFDFSGWATKHDLQCSDGRTIRKGAFKHQDGAKVPLVWNHDHKAPRMVLGHAILEDRNEGVYAYCSLNNSETANDVREIVKHGDVEALSIYANKLQQKRGDVYHGDIKEVSVVLAGANPGAYIDSVIQHGDATDFDAAIYNDGGIDINGGTIIISHADTNNNAANKEDKNMYETTEEENIEDKNDELNHADSDDDSGSGETLKDVFNTLSDKQKKAVYAIVGMATKETDEKAAHSDIDDDDNLEEGEDAMKHNVFENDEKNQGNVLSHAEMVAVLEDGKRYGSLKESFLQHGIEDIEMLFPDAKSINNPPEFIKRPDDWVSRVMNGVHNRPFSRIKSMFADITEDEARAKGYIKGKLKKEEVFSLLKRTTTPQTVYKKQKLDRDDIIDITDFDVVAWLKGEMRMMLNEELARAFLIGDGRLNSDDDKIKEDNIRPIWKDEELFTIRAIVDSKTKTNADARAKEFIRQAIKSRKNYRGSGNPGMYMTEDMLTDCLLLEDKNGRVIYDTEEKLRTALRVSSITTVPVMENQTRSVDGKNYELLGLIVNLNDYSVGADKGGAVNFFDDFDIDYNAQKYLIETRCSGALTKPYSAIAIEFGEVESSEADVAG